MMKIGDRCWKAMITDFGGPGEVIALQEREVISVGPQQIKTRPVAWYRIADDTILGPSKASGSVLIHRRKPTGEWLHTTQTAAIDAEIAKHEARLDQLNGSMRVIELDLVKLKAARLVIIHAAIKKLPESTLALPMPEADAPFLCAAEDYVVKGKTK